MKIKAWKDEDLFSHLSCREYAGLFSCVALTQQPSICVPLGLFIHRQTSSGLIWWCKNEEKDEEEKMLIKTQLLRGADSV